MREQHREVIKKEANNHKNDEPQTVETAIITISRFIVCPPLIICVAPIDLNKSEIPSPIEIVIILPNNKNILMASEQAAEIVDAEAVVIPTKSVPQGLLGNIIARLHSDCSMTFTISSVDGFIVCPPLIICVAPIDLNKSELKKRQIIIKMMSHKL
jgi:hypothetical protein